VFEDYHVREQERQVYLHCSNIWYKGELPWKHRSAFANSSCLFSVVQSTTGVSPGQVLKGYVNGSLWYKDFSQSQSPSQEVRVEGD
jgi:hypothetical protein